MRLKDRVALVTGAARGLGEAIAARLLQEGARVAICDLDAGPLEETTARFAEAHGADRVLAGTVDVSDVGAVDAFVTEIAARWGRLDIVVNNAGIADFSPFDEITPGDLDRVMQVNLDSVLICTRAATPLLEKSPAARVVNLASILGIRVTADAIPYCTSKGAIMTLTKCLAVELAARGIRVNAVAPGCFDTRMARLVDGSKEYESEWFQDIYIKYGRLPLGRTGDFSELAAAVFFFSSDDSSYVTGQTLLVDGGISAHF
ncbi:MAG: SDR family oxidoreductase [Bauldia sp.]|nr:SDR family oxidoreductase [Bauldia sp.]